MNHLHDPERVDEIKGRLDRMRPDSERHWGTMTAPQVIAHCSRGMKMALGDSAPPRMLIGRLIGRFIKPLALRDDAPMRRNSPTVPAMIVGGSPDFLAERARLRALIDRFAAAGPAGCTTAPHPFFGPLTPREWAIQMYKHLDHHLRQFGA